jgi:hypothetical protein
MSDQIPSVTQVVMNLPNNAVEFLGLVTFFLRQNWFVLHVHDLLKSFPHLLHVLMINIMEQKSRS